MRTVSAPSGGPLARAACLSAMFALALASAAGADDFLTASSDTVTRFEETDPAVVYSGFWVFREGGQHLWSGGTAQSAYEAGARATFTFTGTGVTWIGFRNNRTGMARVYVDGVLVAVVDTAGPSPTPTGVWQVPMYTIQGLLPGTHSMTIEVTGDYNRLVSGGAWIVVDAFDVTS